MAMARPRWSSRVWLPVQPSLFQPCTFTLCTTLLARTTCGRAWTFLPVPYESATTSATTTSSPMRRSAWSKHAFYASIELRSSGGAVHQASSLSRRIQAIRHAESVEQHFCDRDSSSARKLRERSGISWHDTHFDDDRDLPDMDQSRGPVWSSLSVHGQGLGRDSLGDTEALWRCIRTSPARYLDGRPSRLDTATLAVRLRAWRARELRATPESFESEQALKEQLGLLARFAGLAPMNFAHKLSLVQAEVHRARGEVLQAMQAYEQASQGARENGYLSEAGLAHALAAEFFQDLGLHQAALHNAEQAVQAWRSWGADALVESLSHRFANLLETSGLSWQSSSDAGKVHTTITQPITPIQLDMESIISASQMLSAETDLEQLLTKMITLVMANSGAENAVLLLRQDNDWFVQARGDSANEKYDVLLNQPFDPADRESGLIPEPVFNYCQRSREVLVVGDAQQDHRFAKDRMIQTHNIKSIACIPALHQGELKAILYLENRQMADVFTMERVEILKHLSSQFGVSVENALLYDSLNKKSENFGRVMNVTTWPLVDPRPGSGTGTFRTDKVYYSDRLIHLIGYAADEFSDTQEEFWSRLHPDDYEATRQTLDQHLKEREPYIVDCRIRTKSGEYRWFHARGQALWDETGEPTRMSGSITDITDRKQAEEGLRQSKEFNQSVLMSLPEHIAVLDREGYILTVNESWMQFARENDARSLGCVGPGVNYLQICREVSENNDTTVTDALNGIVSVLDGSSKFFEMEYPCDSPTEKRWFSMIASPFKGQKGGVIVAHIDISERKMAEAEIRSAYEEIKNLKEQLEAESAYLQNEIKLEHNFENVIGQSEALKYVLHRVEQVAPTDTPVLLTGETGTGKELMARALHKHSPYGKRALVKVNCAALPGELIESELFGREKGAFTGATTTQLGRFELAKGSTLFLDEIGEMPLELQAKLLRVLESGEFERLGSPRTRHSNARIIAATNRVLEEEVRKGGFRRDLWYRLKVFQITVPPLRVRPEDIPLLVKWFVDQFARKMGKQVANITKRTMQSLQNYPWPGNVRELQHAVESALITARGKRLNFELPKLADTALNDFKSLEELERDYILQVLKARDWKIGGPNSASSTLGVHVNTLRGRMKKLGIKKPKL